MEWFFDRFNTFTEIYDVCYYRQLSIELPELTIEHEDNTRNDSLIQDNSLPSDHDTSNHDSRDQSNDNERSPPGIRISNVLISQNIAMNVKVINGDEY